MKKLALVLVLVGISTFNPVFSNVKDSDSTVNVQSEKRSKVDIIDSLIKQRFGNSIQMDGSFEIGCINFVKEETEGIKISPVPGQAHVHLYVYSEDELPSESTLIEGFNERFDYLQSLGLPITPNRYFIKTMKVDNKVFMVIALDEKN